MDHLLTIVLAVFITVSPSQPCQITVQVTHNNLPSKSYIDQPSLYVQAGDSVTIKCSGVLSAELRQDNKTINSPLEFTVTGENLAVTNTIYTCDCNSFTSSVSKKTIIQTVTIPPNFQDIDKPKAWQSRVGECVRIPCQLDSVATGLTVVKEWWYARMSPSDNKVTDVGRVPPRTSCDTDSCASRSACVKAGSLFIPSVRETTRDYVYWCTVRYTQTTHSKLQTVQIV